MKFIQTSKVIAGCATLFGCLSAASAAVTVSVDMDPATAGIQSSVPAVAGQPITVDIVMTVGAEGVSSCGISVNFDNAELSLNGAPASAERLPAGFTTNLNAGVNSESQATGQVRTFEAVTLGNGPVNTSFVLGSISFTVPAPVTDGTADVTPGIFNAGVDGCFDNAGVAVTPAFVSGRVNLFVPQGPWVPIAGTMTHGENFNTLPPADIAWTDSGPLTGWYAQINNGTTPNGTLQASDGTVVLSGLLNCGAAAAADRALGSKATGTGNFANISHALLMRNVGARAMKLSRLRYAEELWRSGSSANLQEKVTVFYAVSAAPLASISSGTSNATAAAGPGFSALPAAASTFISSATINTALDGTIRSAVDFTLAAGTEPVILPGQYFTLKWTDTNENGFTDGHQAIDDVLLDFTELDCAITAAVSDVVRTPGPLLADPADDVVDFRLTVTGSGNVGAGWRVDAPAVLVPNSGTYGTSKNFSNVPIAQFVPDLVLTLADSATATCQTTATLTLPLLLGEITLGGSPSYLQVTGAPAIFRQTGARELTMDPGSAVLTTDAIAVIPGTEKCFTLTVLADDTSTGSGFEADDTLKVELLTSGPGTASETLTSDYDINRDGVISGGGVPVDDEFNLEQQAVAGKWTSTFLLVGTIPASATTFQVRITGAINGNVAGTSTEVYRCKDATVTVCTDTDRDGVNAAREWAHGTNPADPDSFFALSSIASTAGTTTLTVPGITGRTYQVLGSTGLTAWTREGLPASGTGAPLPLTRPTTAARTFRRILVAPVQTVIP
jgi:hypothetical protein